MAGTTATGRPAADNWPARGSVVARGFSFWLDSMLLSTLTVLALWALPGNWQQDNLLFMFLVGIYRVICEFTWGRTIGKTLLSLRVLYRDRTGRERRGADRLMFVLLRNSWLLAAGPLWLWDSDADPGGIMFVLLLSMAFTSFRATVLDWLANARVVDSNLA